ncbi:MAG: HDOD domain-containing protein [Pseudomonadota bacterium]
MATVEQTLIDHLKKMPPLNAALQNTLTLLNAQTSDYKKISSAILQDPVLTGRVLQIANSSFYGSQRRVTDLNIACTMLGMETLRGLVYTLILLTKFRTGPEHSVIDYNNLWKYCLRVACLVKTLAKEQKLDSSIAFTTGLFHCMDLIIQDYFYRETLMQRIATQSGTINSSSTLIATIIDTEHWNLIAILLEFWKFPPTIVDVFKKDNSTQAQQYHERIIECTSFIKKIANVEISSLPTESDNMVEMKLISLIPTSDLLYVELEALLFH